MFLDAQTCSVRGRRINDSINAIKDVIDDANLKNVEAFIVSVDQRKAFDSMFEYGNILFEADEIKIFYS